jgi:hypothetical protein
LTTLQQGLPTLKRNARRVRTTKVNRAARNHHPGNVTKLDNAYSLSISLLASNYFAVR